MIKNNRNIGLLFVVFWVALLSAGIGIGGGAILVSVFVSMFGFDFKKAAGTSLAVIIPVSFTGAVSYFIFVPDIPPLKYYLAFIPACVAGTVLGSGLVRKYKHRWLKAAFGVFLVVAGLKMLKLFDLPLAVYGRGLLSFSALCEMSLIAVFGLSVGIIAVLLGIGCGLIIVPFYTAIIGLDIHETVRLSLTAMFFITLCATLINHRTKVFDVAPLKKLIFGALPGAVIGAGVSSRLPDQLLKQVLAVFLLFMGINFIIRELRWNKTGDKDDDRKNL